jgi:autoinducer 2-degrading protein
LYTVWKIIQPRRHREAQSKMAIEIHFSVLLCVSVAHSVFRLPYPTDQGAPMYIVAVTVFVKPESVEAFSAAILANAQGTRREPGNVRFDVSQSEEDPGKFLLYEAYHTKEDFAAHQQTPHYLAWREAIPDMMAQPRVGARYRSIFFGDGEK